MTDREHFRETCLKRDHYSCVVCGCRDNLSVHHIIERRLFNDGGYIIDNGATLCEPCHLKAESTEYSCEFIREKAGINMVALPDDYYKDHVYTKWGDIILENEQRMKGPLFYDDSVQKILKQGPNFGLYTDFVKYPRTYHLPWSEGKTDDDRTLKDTNHFNGKNVIITEKMDGKTFQFIEMVIMHVQLMVKIIGVVLILNKNSLKLVGKFPKDGVFVEKIYTLNIVFNMII